MLTERNNGRTREDSGSSADVPESSWPTHVQKSSVTGTVTHAYTCPLEEGQHAHSKVILDDIDFVVRRTLVSFSFFFSLVSSTLSCYPPQKHGLLTVH